MGYPTDDGSYPRAGSGRRPEWPSPAGYGEPAGYGAYEDYGDTSGLADPYGPPGAQIDRDPVRGYPPAPDVYTDDGYGADPGYGEQPYGDPGYGAGPGYGGEPGYGPGPGYGHGPGPAGIEAGYAPDQGYGPDHGYGGPGYGGPGHGGPGYGEPEAGGPGSGYAGYESGYGGHEGGYGGREGAYGGPPQYALEAGPGVAEQPAYGEIPGYPPGQGAGYQPDPAYAAAPVYTDQPFHDGAAYRDPSGGYDTGYDAYEQPGPGSAHPDGPPEAPSYPGYESDPYDEPRPVSGVPSGGRGGKSSGKAVKVAKDKRGKLGMVLAVTVGIVVLAVGVTAYMLFTKPKPSIPTAANTAGSGNVQVPGPTSSASAACTSHLGQYCHIETRTLDPTPLSVTEVFPAQFMTMSDHSSFVDEAHQNSKDCSGAVIGSGLQSAIKSGKCSQVLLASYVSGNNKMMGTIGVFNLSTTTAAEKAGHAVDGSDFLSPMSTSKGVTKSLGKGTGVVEAEFKGHYLILTWAEFTDLKSPDAAGDKTLETFESDLVSGTANIALSERMVTGKPASSSS